MARSKNRFGAAESPATLKRKVYISYRKGSADRLKFTEAIAHRLGREGFLQWYDEWEIKAGDTLPREIAEGLNDPYAFVIVLTNDYAGEYAV